MSAKRRGHAWLSVIAGQAGLWLAFGAQPATRPTDQVVPDQPSGTTEVTEGDGGWITTETGLKYRELSVGDGATPRPQDLLRVHYRGLLEDGTVFDSSYGRRDPFQFRIGMKRRQALVAWEEGLATMRAGGRRTLVAPPHLAFGLRGSPPRVPPNATVRFEVELLEVERAPSMPETQSEEEVTTPTGLRYVELRVGTGASPNDNSLVRIRASTWAPDGAIMNTTSEQEGPTTLRMESIGIPALHEGIMGMKVGGKRKLFVPRRRGAAKPPATQPATDAAEVRMIVEVELLGVSDPPAPPVPTETPDDRYTVTSSGLKYYDITAGTGASPRPTSRVRVAFAGWLATGELFDSTVLRDGPVEFYLDQAPFAGWVEGVSTMRVGGKRKLVVPPELGYGNEQRPGIPPNSTLILEVELLEVVRR